MKIDRIKSIEEYKSRIQEMMKAILPIISTDFILVAVLKDGLSIQSTMPPDLTKKVIDEIHQTVQSRDFQERSIKRKI